MIIFPVYHRRGRDTRMRRPTEPEDFVAWLPGHKRRGDSERDVKKGRRAAHLKRGHHLHPLASSQALGIDIKNEMIGETRRHCRLSYLAAKEFRAMAANTYGVCYGTFVQGLVTKLSVFSLEKGKFLDSASIDAHNYSYYRVQRVI